jgi:hypothetical protein
VTTTTTTPHQEKGNFLSAPFCSFFSFQKLQK